MRCSIMQTEAKKLMMLEEDPEDEADVDARGSPKRVLGRSGTCPHDEEGEEERTTIAGSVRNGRAGIHQATYELLMIDI